MMFTSLSRLNILTGQQNQQRTEINDLELLQDLCYLNMFDG